jgi:hypothetical protein
MASTLSSAKASWKSSILASMEEEPNSSITDACCDIETVNLRPPNLCRAISTTSLDKIEKLFDGATTRI